MVLKATLQKKVPNNRFLSQFEKVTVQKPIMELWAGISNQMIKYQLPHTRFNQFSDHQHVIYLNGKLSTRLLAQTANKSTKFVFTKTGRFFLKYVFKSDRPEKF